jgi:acyl carrier protein
MLMDLVLFVEQTWGVQLMGSDFAPRNFRTVEQLAQLVETRRLAQSA